MSDEDAWLQDRLLPDVAFTLSEIGPMRVHGSGPAPRACCGFNRRSSAFSTAWTRWR